MIIIFVGEREYYDYNDNIFHTTFYTLFKQNSHFIYIEINYTKLTFFIKNIFCIIPR